MATEAQYLNALRGPNSRVRCTQVVTLTINHTTVSKGTAVLPAGSIFRSIDIETPTAITGSPTTANVRAGITDTGQEVVADVDAKGQGHIASTIVATLDKVGSFSAADTTIYVQGVAAGGTGEAGTIYALVSYDAPLP